MKKYCSVIVFLCFSSSLVWGAENNLGDCGLFAQNNIPSINFVDSFDIGSIYPSKNREIAGKNLKAYCCATYKSQAEEQQRGCDGLSDYYADSNLLYDHLVDVGFRSLDGDKDLAYEGQELDSLGEKRHELMYGKEGETGYANNPLGAVPLQIWKDFGRYRGIDEQGSVQYDLNDFMRPKDNIRQYTTYKSLRDVPIRDGILMTDYIGLASRYFIICHISQSIVANGSAEVNGFSACKNIARKRIFDENNYIQHILITQGLQALTSNFNAYTQGYLLQGEFSRLLEKILEMNTGLSHINAKVSEITRMCSG